MKTDITEGICTGQISIIVPVKNNQKGIDSLLQSIFETQQPSHYPREIIIVDNYSEPPLVLNKCNLSAELEIKLIVCKRPGPAAARNEGAKHASGKWLLFIDSDCLASATLLSGYQRLKADAVGYSGFIGVKGSDLLSNYYLSQNIHLPPPDLVKRPKYLVTANALVSKSAFNEVGGFDESFESAGGEDIDLAMRLKKIGKLAFATESQILHHFEDGYIGFVRRFLRYGKGLGMVKLRHSEYQFPLPFTANNKKVLINNFLVIVQWLCMYFGYKREVSKGVNPRIR